MLVEIPVSVGELVDKITILQIKSQLLTQEAQLLNVRRELALLLQRLAGLGLAQALLDTHAQELLEVNQQLWHIEDFKRQCERAQDWGAAFVQAARQVYILNDRRASIKRALNQLVGSDLVEEKSHTTVNT
jgi:sugar phosphate isomerase/epimerase